MAKRTPSKKAAAKGGRAAARSRKSPVGRKKARSKVKKGSSKNFIQSAIKRPGALTQKAGGKLTVAKARKLAKSKNPKTRQQANFFLNVLKPASKKKRRKKG